MPHSGARPRPASPQSERGGRSSPNKAGAPFLALAMLIVFLFAGCGAAPDQDALPVYGEVPAFGLTDQLGHPVTTADLAGKVAIANFIYTSCRETCPLLTQRLQVLQERLRGEQLLGSRVLLLSITVDPARDTVEVLRDYAARHQADPAAWRFLTGPEGYLIPLISQGFKLGLQPVGDEVMHSNRILLIDPQGRIRAYYDGLELEETAVLGDVRRLLPATP
jgi:protein SCO1/2